jgi:hypothetical protein
MRIFIFIYRNEYIEDIKQRTICEGRHTYTRKEGKMRWINFLHNNDRVIENLGKKMSKILGGLKESLQTMQIKKSQFTVCLVKR